MDILSSILRNFRAVENCIFEENGEFLSLLIPKLVEHFCLFSRILKDENLSEDARLLFLGLESEFQKQIDKCFEFYSRAQHRRNIRARVPSIQQNHPGRRKYDFSADQINALRSYRLSWSKISDILNVDRKTLFNFRKNTAENFENRRIISEEELRRMITNFKKEHPKAGYRYVWAHLKAQNILVTWKSVVRITKEIDPDGVNARQRRCLKRRKYRTKGANYMWHMDGNEKLVQWNFYIHGCTDGYSRKIIYLQLATTKKAATVLKIFEKGVKENGLPIRVRGDRGTENVRVKDYMHSMRPDFQNPFIVGRSVHNTRIERLWGEVNRVVSHKFRLVFSELEEEELFEYTLLDSLCLCYIFHPRIQHNLDSFKNLWNCHGLRSENSSSPNQLWLTSLLDLNLQKDIFALNLVPEYLDPHPVGSTRATFDLDLHTFDLDPAIITRFNNVARDVVPNPSLDDSNEGKTLYLLLRNHLLSVHHHYF